MCDVCFVYYVLYTCEPVEYEGKQRMMALFGTKVHCCQKCVCGGAYMLRQMCDGWVVVTGGSNV